MINKFKTHFVSERGISLYYSILYWNANNLEMTVWKHCRFLKSRYRVTLEWLAFKLRTVMNYWISFHMIYCRNKSRKPSTYGKTIARISQRHFFLAKLNKYSNHSQVDTEDPNLRHYLNRNCFRYLFEFYTSTLNSKFSKVSALFYGSRKLERFLSLSFSVKKCHAETNRNQVYTRNNNPYTHPKLLSILLSPAEL